MRQVVIVLGNPANPEDMVRMATDVNALLGSYQSAKLTWLQSAASRQTNRNGQIIMVSQHLLTCAVEYDVENPANKLPQPGLGLGDRGGFTPVKRRAK